MKKKTLVFLTLILSLCAALFFAVGCSDSGNNDDDKEPSGGGEVTVEYAITNKPTDNELLIDTSVTLGYSVTPSGATAGTVTWNSSNTDVATITDGGTLTGVQIGRSTVSLLADGQVKDSFVINVYTNEKIITMLSIVGSDETLSMEVEETKTLGFEVEPVDHTESFSFVSDNETVVSVDGNGNLTAHALGTAKITLQNEDGTVKDELNVRVIEVKSFTADFSTAVYSSTDNKVHFTKGGVTSVSTVGDLDATQTLSVETYKNNNYIQWINAYEQGSYHTFGFAIYNKLYKGYEYTVALDVQHIYGLSATGIAFCWANDPVNARIVTDHDASTTHNVTLHSDYDPKYRANGFNRIEFAFTAPQDIEVFYVILCDANGKNVIAVNDLQVVRTSEFVSSEGVEIKKFVEDFRFATTRANETSPTYNDILDYFVDLTAWKVLFTAPHQHDDAPYTLETVNGKQALVRNNNYTDSYHLAEMIQYFDIAEGKQYKFTIDYSVIEGTFARLFYLYYSDGTKVESSDDNSTDGNEVKCIIDSAATGTVSWTFTASKNCDGLLFKLADFSGNNKVALTAITIEEI